MCQWDEWTLMQRVASVRHHQRRLAACEPMHKRYQTGQEPAHIKVADLARVVYS
jgi:hypothetical protein